MEGRISDSNIDVTRLCLAVMHSSGNCTLMCKQYLSGNGFPTWIWLAHEDTIFTNELMLNRGGCAKDDSQNRSLWEALCTLVL